MIGSLFSFYVTKHKIISLILIISIFIFVLIIAILKHKLKYFIIPVLTFIFSCSFYNISINNFNKSVETVPATITARIYSISNEDNGVLRVKADECKFDGKNVNTNINVLIYDSQSIFANIEVGRIISFTPNKFYKSDLEYNNSTPNAKMFYENLKYTVTCKYEDVSFYELDKTFVEKIKEHVKDNLAGNLTNENVEIAYSALFGDKDYISEEQYSAYRLSGIAHVLAVSGLHVSIIVSILITILSLFRTNGWLKFVIVALFLGLYAYICNFSVSVIRASIMSLMAMLALLLGKEYDPLTAVGFAGIIIFLINPLCIYDISFLMSFACALGIILFSKPISIALQKAKITKRVADAIALSSATLISLIFISAYYFHNFNAISLIANILLIPVFTIAFSIVFVVSLLSLIFSSITVILSPINYIFDFINVVATVLGNLKYANLTTIQFNFIVIPIYFILLFIISRICVARDKNKVIISLPILAIMLLFLI